MREVIPSDRILGAEVRGVDLSEKISEDTRQFVLDAWHNNLVLLFRDQNLTDEDLLRLAGDFGGAQVAGSRSYYIKAGHQADTARVSKHPGISVVSNLDENGKPVKTHSGTGSLPLTWHTDNSYVENPPKGSILYGIQTPVNGGGDTSFCNQYEAYAQLSDALKEKVVGFHVRQDTSRNTAGQPRPTAKRPESVHDVEGPVHPMVRIHPATGRHALYLGRRYQPPSSYIVEMPNDEGEALLDELWAHATQPDFVWTHQWQPKDVLMWDNRCVMHTRSAIDETQPRELHRTLIAGEAVVPAHAPYEAVRE
ncbi:MAG: TauD/TfdA family dioxygenase [Chromatiales bacterium]|jgi:taurine dioxygenase|nr:TauD/TfdA family dioxygenase [Chromatiales bacterium]